MLTHDAKVGGTPRHNIAKKVLLDAKLRGITLIVARSRIFRFLASKQERPGKRPMGSETQ